MLHSKIDSMYPVKILRNERDKVWSVKQYGLVRLHTKELYLGVCKFRNYCKTPYIQGYMHSKLPLDVEWKDVIWDKDSPIFTMNGNSIIQSEFAKLDFDAPSQIQIFNGW